MKKNKKKKIIKNRTVVFVDAANMFYSQKTLKFKVDYEKLYKYFSKEYYLIEVSYYTGYDPENQGQLKFLSKLEKFGYRLIKKPLKVIKSNTGRIDKANVDVELAIDAVLKIDLYETFVLASGDSDFSYLVDILKKRQKKVIVLSSRGHISKELARMSDKLITLESLKEDIALEKNHPARKRGKLS